MNKRRSRRAMGREEAAQVPSRDSEPVRERVLGFVVECLVENQPNRSADDLRSDIAGDRR